MTANKTWGDYEIFFDQVLGRGGMGAVYKGRQISVNRPVAIKILKRDLTESADFVNRFNREATLLAKLVDNHIVQIFGAGADEGQHFYAMEFVEGEDLASRLRRGYQFTPEEILQITIQTAMALQAAWKEKIIHRDIKPSNILITKEGTVKVMDFGLAKNPENDLTQTEMIMGTAKYMSPEQATGGRCDIRSDLYSLGAVMYELATGTAPFVGESPTAVIYQHVHKAPVPPQKLNPSIPASLQSAVLRLLAKNPEERYQTPDDVMKDCKAILDGVNLDEKTVLYSETSGHRAETGVTIPVPPQKSSGIGMYASIVVAVAALGGGGYFVWKAMKNQPTKLSPTNGHRPEDPSNKPDWEVKYDEAKKQADGAFDARQWTTAKQEYEKALGFLPGDHGGRAEIARRINLSRYREIMEIDTPKASLGNRILLYGEAVRIAVDEADRRTAQAFLDRAEVERAEGEAKLKLSIPNREDWAGAAAAYAEAAKHEQDEAKRKTFEEQSAFYDSIDRYKRSDNLEEIKSVLEKLRQGKTYGYTDMLRQDLADVEKRIADREAELERQRERKYGELLAQARGESEKGRWAKAGELLSEVERETYAKYRKPGDVDPIRKILKQASACPAGMVFVPAGAYPVGDGHLEDSAPLHDEKLNAFYIDDAEVKVIEYLVFLHALAEAGDVHRYCPAGEPGEKDTHVPYKLAGQKAGDPVTGVDWWDACAYAAWKGKRLPTEFEFETAASYDYENRKKSAYPWGDKFGVGSGKSPLGLDGLANTVREWTTSEWKGYPGNPRSFAKGERVIRGGRRAGGAEEELLGVYRHHDRPRKQLLDVGFRCALSAKMDE